MVVVCVGSVAEYLEEGEVGGLIGRLRESLDLRRLQQLGEDECVGVRGCADDKVGGGARGVGCFGQG